MYNYRITSFLIFTGSFWSVEMVCSLIVWLVLTYFVFPPEEETPPLPKRELGSAESQAIKQEEEDDKLLDDLSDTERSFPTYSRHPPLRYSSPRVKDEEEEKMPLEMAPLEADDEDEDADFVLDEPGRLGRQSDSGLGTSMESSAPRSDSVRRRKSGMFGGSNG